MQEMIFRNTFRWRLRPHSVTAEAAYGTRENVAAIEKAAIRAYIALPEQGKRTSLFTIEDFVYDAQRDLYTCPPKARRCGVGAATEGEGRSGTPRALPPASPAP